MRELTYLAEMANLKFSISIDDNGILLEFYGFNSSMKNYCAEIFKKICEFKVDNLQDDFEVQKKKIEQDKNNFWK